MTTALAGCLATNAFQPSAPRTQSDGSAVSKEIEQLRNDTEEIAKDGPNVDAASFSGTAVVPEPEPFRIALDDELEISVYNDSSLNKTQLVRPDGKVAFPFAGEVQVAGLTPEEVRRQITDALIPYFKDPEVTVTVTAFKSRKISILGEVSEPGVYALGSSVQLLEALALAGGITDRADLRRAVVIRSGQVLSIDFLRLIRKSDLTQNVALAPHDIVLVPNAVDQRVMVLGEVVNPTIVTMEQDVTVLESIVRAQGFTKGAKKGSVLVLRGGLRDPEVLRVDAGTMLEKGDLSQNISLMAGDVVYVSKSFQASLADFLADLRVGTQLTYILGGGVTTP